MIGDQLDFGDTVCGAVLSIRFGEDILSVWNRNAADNQVQRQLLCDQGSCIMATMDEFPHTQPSFIECHRYYCSLFLMILRVLRVAKQRVISLLSGNWVFHVHNVCFAVMCRQ